MPRFQLCLSNTLLVGQFVLFHFVYSIQQSIAKLTASLSGVKKVSLLLVRVFSLPFSSLTTVSTTSVNRFRASGSSKASAIPARIKMGTPAIKPKNCFPSFILHSPCLLDLAFSAEWGYRTVPSSSLSSTNTRIHFSPAFNPATYPELDLRRISIFLRQPLGINASNCPL